MWKLWHKLFGWDYIVVTIGRGFIFRVHDAPNGTRLIYMGSEDACIMNFDGTFKNSRHTWEPLTFKRCQTVEERGNMFCECSDRLYSSRDPRPADNEGSRVI